MSRFSPSDCAIEGFHVIRDHWRIVAGWAVFNLLALLAMIVRVVVVLLGLYGSGIGENANSAAVAGAIVGGIGYGLVQVMLVTALCRLMLEGGPPGFLYLRIGKDEFRFLVSALAVIAALVLVGVVATKLSSALSVPVGLVVAVGGYAVLLRFFIAPIMSVARRRIVLRDAWTFTRGHVWRLVGMWLLTLCLVALVALVTWLAMFVVSGLLTGFQDLGMAGADKMAAHPGRYVLQLVVEMLLAPALTVLAQAPWIAAYRALSAREVGEA